MLIVMLAPGVVAMAPFLPDAILTERQVRRWRARRYGNTLTIPELRSIAYTTVGVRR